VDRRIRPLRRFRESDRGSDSACCCGPWDSLRNGVTGERSASLIKKLIRKPTHTYDSLPDKAGARCVVRYRRELARVVEAAKSTFDCGPVDDKLGGLGTEKVGYSGIHIEVKLRSDDPDATRFRGCQAELQIKTLGQQLWAEMAHDSVYKNDEAVNALSGDYKRRINLMAGLVEVADREFERLDVELPRDDAQEAYRALEPHYYRLTAGRPDIELSLEIIRLLLPLYGTDTKTAIARLNVFLDANRNKLAGVYGAEERQFFSELMFQPEALMLFERLTDDIDATRQAWSTTFPDSELERVAVNFGLSFD
jgi:ppGpp synthetase/RelA/SpoT-type nucleotidyltranferase